jgi:hypothetical protein
MASLLPGARFEPLLGDLFLALTVLPKAGLCYPTCYPKMKKAQPFSAKPLKNLVGRTGQSWALVDSNWNPSSYCQKEVKVCRIGEKLQRALTADIPTGRSAFA